MYPHPPMYYQQCPPPYMQNQMYANKQGFNGPRHFNQQPLPGNYMNNFKNGFRGWGNGQFMGNRFGNAQGYGFQPLNNAKQFDQK